MQIGNTTDSAGKEEGGKEKMEKRSEDREHYKHRGDNTNTQSKYVIKKTGLFSVSLLHRL